MEEENMRNNFQDEQGESLHVDETTLATHEQNAELYIDITPASSTSQCDLLLTTQPICIEPESDLHSLQQISSTLNANGDQQVAAVNEDISSSHAIDSSNTEKISTSSHDDDVHVEETTRKRKLLAPSPATTVRLEVKHEPEDDDVIVTGQTVVMPRKIAITQVVTANMRTVSTSSRSTQPRPLVTVSNKFVRLATNLVQTSTSGAASFTTLRELIGSDGRRAEVVVQTTQPTNRVAANGATKAVRILGNKLTPVSTWTPPRIAPAVTAKPLGGTKTNSSSKSITVVALPAQAGAHAISLLHTAIPPPHISIVQPSASVNGAPTAVSNSARSFIEGIGMFPSYKPEATDIVAIHPGGLKDYKCNACGDTFLFATSLQDHLSRKSCLLVYDCQICNQILTFHNRCLLLLHFGDDAMKTGKPPSLRNYERVKLKALPEEEDDSCVRLSLQTDSGSMCPVCKQQVQEDCLADHMSLKTSARVRLNTDLSCDTCGRVMATRCALVAHRNIHSKRMPYICPECGTHFTHGNWASFQHHMQYTCFHFARQTLLMCPTCKCQIAMATFVAHLVDHMTIYYKCSLCPMAFHSKTLLQEHWHSLHKDTDGVSCRQIVKCQICGVILQHAAQSELYSHMHSHAVSHWSDYLSVTYACPRCPQSKFVDRESLILHDKQIHTSSDFPSSVCELCGQSFADSAKLARHWENCNGFVLPPVEQTVSSQKALGVLTATSIVHHPIDLTSDGVDEKLRCTKCQVLCEDMVKLAKHMRRHEVIASKKATFALRKPIAFSGKQVPVSSSVFAYTCSKCDEGFDNQGSLDSHKRDKHGETIMYPCLLCGLLYCTDAQRNEHVSLVHEGTGQARYSCPLCAQSGKQVYKGNQSALSRHIIQGHKVKKERAKELASRSLITDKSAEDQSQELPSDDMSPSVKRLKTGDSSTFMCAKCGYATESRGLFILHIAVHRRPNEEGVQCFECGLTFTVLPAIKRHLHIVHDIQNFDTYTKDTGFSLEDGKIGTSNERKLERSSGSTDDSSGPKDCSVCGKMFDSDSLLRQHMRTHGMAFIHSKRGPLSDTN